MSLELTKTRFFLGIIRSPTFRLSKFIMAAIRLRSLALKMFLGVRRRTSINSSRDFGAYLGAGDFLGRYFSSLGSINLTNFFIKLSNMI